MAALTAITRLVSSGQRIIAGDDIYGGTSRLLTKVLPKQNIPVDIVEMTDPAAVEAALKSGAGMTRLVMVETPTNPRLQVCAREGVAWKGRECGAWSGEIRHVVFLCILAAFFPPRLSSAYVCTFLSRSFLRALPAPPATARRR